MRIRRTSSLSIPLAAIAAAAAILIAIAGAIHAAPRGDKGKSPPKNTVVITGAGDKSNAHPKNTTVSTGDKVAPVVRDHTGGGPGSGKPYTGPKTAIPPTIVCKYGHCKEVPPGGNWYTGTPVYPKITDHRSDKKGKNNSGTGWGGGSSKDKK